MTRRQRLEAVINGEITEELIESCRVELEKLNERGGRSKEELTPSQEENERVGRKVCEILENEEGPLQIEEIREMVAPEFTRQRMTAVCTNLIREGRIRGVELKVSGKGKRRGYVKN